MRRRPSTLESGCILVMDYGIRESLHFLACRFTCDLIGLLTFCFLNASLACGLHKTLDMSASQSIPTKSSLSLPKVQSLPQLRSLAFHGEREGQQLSNSRTSTGSGTGTSVRTMGAQDLLCHPDQLRSHGEGRRPGQATGNDWMWCLQEGTPGGRSAPSMESQVSEGLRASSSLTSASTLSPEGRRERQRIMATCEMEPLPAVQRLSRRPQLEQPEMLKLPQTTSQMIGSRVAHAEKATKFLPKNTCDIVRFTDAATKTMTPYRASIRF
mmetsp:Transcript_125358/g.244114  ORF Transcript_125358/g.244114 Transcript_125358/m.244114 type:complete len:269 (+) Transcript_125358:83-889(+)